MKWYPYGHDFGNTEIGGVVSVNGEARTQTLPTALARIDAKRLDSLNYEFKADDHMIRITGSDDDYTYAVGLLTMRQAAQDAWNGRNDIHRYTSKHSLRAMLVNAGSLISDREFGLYVVTGLPAETYIKNTSMRADIKKALDGSYRFTLDNGATWRIAHVEVATVVMEGAGALIYHGKQQNGEAKTSGVIDVGGRTTDLYAAAANVPQTDLCKGKALGVEAAANLLRDRFADENEGYELSDLETREILRAYVSGSHNYPAITVYGREVNPFDIETLTKQAVSKIGQEIVSFVSSAWRQNERGSIAINMSPVLMIGGGVYYFYNDLKARIPHLVSVHNPVFANALGYRTLAQQLLARKSEAKTA